MSFWLTAALLTFLACAALLWPFRRGATLGATQSSHDIEVYRDQLLELDRDKARGMVGAREAEEARAEIGRRLLRAADGPGPDNPVRGNSGRMVATAAVLAVPLIAWGGYALTGSPALPDQRLAERLARNPAESSVAELIVRAEQHLAADPSDGRGWEVLAPIYLRTGRMQDAVTAWRNAIRLSGSNAPREAGLGEALMAAASGVVTAEAEAAFARALVLDPAEPRSRYFTALALLQEGREDVAAAAWRVFAADLPADSPWRAPVARALESLNVAGPDAEDVAAAAAMSSEDRQEMIQGMVAGLDAKLRENPLDPEGWRRLVRSYQVLGENDAAADAVARGVAALGKASQAAADLLSFAGSIGVKAEAVQ